MQRTEHHASFGGRQEVWQHNSTCTGTPMKFGIYLPPKALAGEACPVLYWLSGLTCTEQNFITKAGAQRHAAEHGLILVTPDTSPRGETVADDAAYDLGQGAGFYLNATQQPWAAHFRMEDYVVQELPALVEQHFPALALRAISGHSMGGHGALTLSLRHPGQYKSVSAFAPICAPAQVPWGQKAFATYLGAAGSGHDASGMGPAAWLAHDACALIAQARTERLPLLVDQGEADEFLHTQLRPDLLRAACQQAGHPLTLRLQPGHDHSYYFIASFIGEHIAHHAQALQRAA